METKMATKLDDVKVDAEMTKLDEVKVDAEMATKLDDEKMDTKSSFDEFKLYRLEDSEGKENTLLRVPKHIRGAGPDPTNNFNLLMADVSFSMHTSWPLVIDAWNDYIANQLVGKKILLEFWAN